MKRLGNMVLFARTAPPFSARQLPNPFLAIMKYVIQPLE